MKNKWQLVYMYALAAILVLGFVSIVFALIFHLVPDGNNNLVYLTLGLLGSYSGQVINYLYGSSKGSADKTDMLYNSTPIQPVINKIEEVAKQA